MDFALVTGGAKRVGGAICDALHASGCNVIIHTLSNEKAAHERAGKLNAIRENSAFVLVADLMNPDSVYVLAVEAKKLAQGSLKYLVNAAALFESDGAVPSIDSWNAMMAVNARAPWMLTLSLDSVLKENNGAVVNIIDSHTDQPMAGFTAYTASKAALLGITNSMAVELAPIVRVNAVSPGLVVCEEDIPNDSEQRRQFAERCALKRHATEYEIADAVIYLLTKATFMTGEVMKVDGGRGTTF